MNARQRVRLDVALTERGLAESRSKAQALIMAGRILVNGSHVTKAGALVNVEDVVAVESLEHPWVGRGGMKLAQALLSFKVSVVDRTCVDIGASTGGFTDVLLQHGARKVYAIDAGHGQLDQKLRNDPRVVNREKTNARYLDEGSFAEAIEFVSIDVSFISLKLIFPAVSKFLSGDLIALVKPQFEVGKGDVGKGGIVRDVAKRADALAQVIRAAAENHLPVIDTIESPIKGAEGNVEYLIWSRKEDA